MDLTQLSAKVTEFTVVERVILDAWQDLRDAGHYAFAADVLFAGLEAEHFRSVLSEDPAQITTAEATEYTRLLKVLDDLLHQAGAQLNKTYGRK